jgi:hypothetical protein
MTISLWLEPQHMGGMRYIISRAITDPEDLDCALMRHLDGEIELAVGQSGTEPISVISSATAPLNQWTHVAITLNGSEASIYINGQFDSSVTYATRALSEGYNLTIGSHQDDTRFYNGKLDDIRIYNLALNKDQIEELAQ